MDFEFDPDKGARNVRERGLPFDLVADFDFDTAVIVRDLREDYGDTRFIAVGLIGSRVYAVASTLRGRSFRVISLRKANAREVKRYEQARS